MRDLYRDFRQDWRRWTCAERVTAGLIAVLALAGPAMLVLSGK